MLTALDEAVFTLRGFPTSIEETPLRVVMSRYIERRALEVGAGRLDAAFLRLSRIRDEHGTRTAYDCLGATDVGVPEMDGVVVHGGDGERYRRSWFVVFVPPAESTTEPAALVAVGTESNARTSTWTYDSDRVDGIERCVVETFREA